MISARFLRHVANSSGIVLLLFIFSSGVALSVNEGPYLEPNGYDNFLLNQSKMTISTPVENTVLIQTHLSPAKIDLTKACARNEERCVREETRTVCEQRWRQECRNVPDRHCFQNQYRQWICEDIIRQECRTVPYTHCYPQTYCAQTQVFIVPVNYSISLNFDPGSLIQDPSSRRYFAIKCGGLDEDYLELVTNASDVRIRKAFLYAFTRKFNILKK